MGNDNRAEIVLDGDISPLQRKMREAGVMLKQFGNEGETALGRLTGPLGVLQSKFVAIGALLAGGAVFKEAVAQTVLLTEESTKLGRALGESASNASILREALTAGNTSQEEFVGAAQKLAKQVKDNEGGLQAMGLQTRDAAGQLRPLTDLMLDAIGVLNGYRAGTDRAIAGQVMFGKGFEMTSNLALMNKEAVAEVEQQMRALGMVASTESVAAWQAYDDASDAAALTLKGLKTTIGNALLPVLTQLGNWFAAIGPAAVVVLKGAVGGLISIFWGLKNAVVISFEIINAAVVQITEPLRALAVGMWKALSGDFAGAKAEFTNIPKVWNTAWDKAFTSIAESAKDTRDKIYNLFADGTPTVGEGKGGKSARGLLKDKDGKTKKAAEDPSHMGTYEAVLAERKNLYEQENVLRQFSKQQELAYWRELQATYAINSKDQLAIAKRTATLELEIRREAAKSERDLLQIGLDHRRNMALAQVQFDEQAARFARENGEITQRQLIAQEEDFARRRFEIEYQAVLERMELAKTDPAASPVALAQLKEQLLEIERNYQLRKGELSQDKKQADGSLGGMFEDIGSSFGTAANAILTRATTLQQQLAGIFQGIYTSFITNLVTKPLGEWIASQARMLAVKMGFLTAEKGLEAAGAVSTVAIKTAESTAVVAANAAEAGSGAAASQASIPIIGPGLALAAMAAVFAAVMALTSRKSAARGYDIPKGLNPVTQLHEEEMVLPQKYANVIRGMVGGGGGEGGQVFAPTVQITAMNSRDVGRALRSGGTLDKELHRLHRRFAGLG